MSLLQCTLRPFMKGDERESVRDERDRQRGGEREKHTGSPPTIPLAGTVICCMHASRDGQTRPGSRAGPGDLWIYANAGSQSPEQPPPLNNALIRQETSAHMPLPTLPSAIDLSPFCSEIHLHNLSPTAPGNVLTFSKKLPWVCESCWLVPVVISNSAPGTRVLWCMAGAVLLTFRYYQLNKFFRDKRIKFLYYFNDYSYHIF